MRTYFFKAIESEGGDPEDTLASAGCYELRILLGTIRQEDLPVSIRKTQNGEDCGVPAILKGHVDDGHQVDEVLCDAVQAAVSHVEAVPLFTNMKMDGPNGQHLPQLQLNHLFLHREQPLIRQLQVVGSEFGLPQGASVPENVLV
jgi:hypothetical protein